jgi:outer membrane protein assembly factor BamB
VVLFGAGDGSVNALEEKTGKSIWRADIGERIRSTPAVSEGVIFVGTVQGRLHALALTDGAPRWTFDTEGTKLDSSKFGYDRRSIQSSPAVANGVVYFSARDGWVYAVGASDGKERWRYADGNAPNLRHFCVICGSGFDVRIQTDDRRFGIERVQVRQQTGTHLGRRTRGVEREEIAGAAELVRARGRILCKP